MDHKDKCKKAVSGRELESLKEKMKRSLMESNNGEAEPFSNEVAAAANNSSTTMRECDICGKMFNGGKALGGHRRSHFHKSAKKVKVRSPSKNNYTNHNDGDYERRVCCICKKKFPTKSALCGHMRSHPERSWRGVSPPTLALKPSSSSSLSYSSSLNSDSMEKNHDGNEDDDDVGGKKVIAPSYSTIDLSRFTSPSWLKKDKRGRSTIGAIQAAETLACFCSSIKFFLGDSSNRVAQQNDDEAVLPKSAPPLTKHGKRKNIGESSRGNNHAVGKKLKFYGDDDVEKVNRCNKDSLSESDLTRIIKNMDNDVVVEQGVDENVMNTEETLARVQDHDGGERKTKKLDQKGKIGVKKLVVKSKGKDTEFESGNNQEKVGGYPCGACGKVFSTFQGLGGHRSIHKEKNIVAVAVDEANDVILEEINSSTSSNMDKVDDALLNEGAGEARDQDNKALVEFDLNEVPSNNVMQD